MTGRANTLRFRFNRSNGVVSGFRVLAFNFVTAAGEMVLPSSAFAQEEPDTWVPPRRDPLDIAMGKRHWYAAELVANSFPGAPITESMLTAWLDKNLKYRSAQYFNQGTSPASQAYTLSNDLGVISGGNVWLSAPQFQAAGVSQDTIVRLLKWGRAYARMAASLHY